MQDQINAIISMLCAIVLLILAAFSNYIRTLNKQTLITDLSILKAVLSGGYICIGDEVDWKCFHNHKEVPCRKCGECKNSQRPVTADDAE